MRKCHSATGLAEENLIRSALRNMVLIRNEITEGEWDGKIQQLCQGYLGFKTQPTGNSRQCCSLCAQRGFSTEQEGVSEQWGALFEALFL
jgi:hypothetical protein